MASPSRTLDAVSESGRFNIHILAGDPSGAALADRFTRGNEASRAALERLALEAGELSSPSPEDGANESPPMLVGEGVLYVLRCQLLDHPSGGLVPVRDHVIVLGQVLDIAEGRGASKGHGEDPFGLIYADRTYRTLGKALVNNVEDGTSS
jgi:flavin reductase (DIM6/NTAB) family NADH-FMN oxidoreductase RutF